EKEESGNGPARRRPSSLSLRSSYAGHASPFEAKRRLRQDNGPTSCRRQSPLRRPGRLSSANRPSTARRFSQPPSSAPEAAAAPAFCWPGAVRDTAALLGDNRRVEDRFLRRLVERVERRLVHEGDILRNPGLRIVEMRHAFPGLPSRSSIVFPFTR